MNTNYTKNMMIWLAVAFMILPLIAVCLRIWAKRLSKRFGWDDFLTIAALAVSLTCSILQLASKFSKNLHSMNSKDRQLQYTDT